MFKAGKFIFQDRDALGRMQPLMDSVGFGSQSGSGVNGQNLSAGSSKLDRSRCGETVTLRVYLARFLSPERPLTRRRGAIETQNLRRRRRR